VGSNPTILIVKLRKEKRIRNEYLDNKLDHIVELITRSTTGGSIERKGRKSYRNICHVTGRSRGIIKQYTISRFIYRSQADKGKLEGIRRAT
jgi:ribosomal protein S14